MATRKRSTIRLRLTLFYGFMFLLCGVGLLYVSYEFVDEALRKDEGKSDQRVIETYGYDRSAVDFFFNLPTPPSPTRPNTRTVGQVIKEVQADIRQDTLSSLVRGSGVALAGMIVVSIGLGWLVAGRALRPVAELTERAQRLSENNLHQRLAIEGPNDELKELADTLDGMLARLERAFESQRRFAATVSHELRTPLAVLRAESDLLLDDPTASERERQLAGTVRDQATRSEALLESLLALARSESTMSDREQIDLADLAGDVVAERIEAADEAGLHVDLELASAPTVVEGDRWLLERLMVNLVDNAINHNVAGGWVKLAIRSAPGAATIAVENTGEHLSVEQVDEILKPFHRATADRPGYGLGMTIIQSVAKLHNGTVSVRPRAEGGLSVEVRLPAPGVAGRPQDLDPEPTALPSVEVTTTKSSTTV
ncbi:MAG: HAMP domain-containing histidine kinase [Acidimicrobiales bacterium]|nr:HAMP domain-containing histidine kinase [Acidimicrobiales bacterium]